MIKQSIRCLVIAATLFMTASPGIHARQTRTVSGGVYTDAEARQGQQLYGERCAACHGPALQGQLAPPLTGAAFMSIWGAQPLSELVSKIRNTMPANMPGTLTDQQATDLAAFIAQTGKSSPAAPPAAAIAPVASHPTYPPAANLGQLMRGIFFPSSNLIFNVQTHDPGERGSKYEPPANAGFSWVDWGAGIYSGWELVDYAAVSIADSAPLLLAPGRRCENGRPVPVERADWIRFTTELVEAGKAAYKASQTRNQEAVSDVSNQLANACLHCHEVYRDKPGGTAADPSNKAARCF